MKKIILAVFSVSLMACGSKDSVTDTDKENQEINQQSEKKNTLEPTHKGIVEEITIEEMETYEEGTVEYKAVAVSFQEGEATATVWIPVDDELWERMKSDDMVGKEVDLHIGEDEDPILLYP